MSTLRRIIRRLLPKGSSRTRMLVTIGCAALVLAFVGLSISYWVATRSWFIVWRITPLLEERLGGDVTIGHASYEGNGKILFGDVVLYAPNIQGDAARVAWIDRALVTVDLRRFFTWGVRIASIELDGTILRISEDGYESGRLNVFALAPIWTQDPTAERPPPPRIQIRDATVEFGWHDHAGFRLNSARHVAGEMNPTPGTTDLYNFKLSEINDRGVGLINGLTIKGEWDAAANEWNSRLDGLDLDGRLYWMCPHLVRVMWDEMNLEGRVDHVAMTWNPKDSFLMSLGIDSVDLTLPVDTQIRWARYRDGAVQEVTTQPRMHFRSGVINMTLNSVELNDMTGVMRGESDEEAIVEVPYRITFRLPELPELKWAQRDQWVDGVLAHAPFEMQYRTENLTMKRDAGGQSPAVDLPMFVANVLQKFEVTEWVLTTSVDVSRGQPERDSEGAVVRDAEPMVNGHLYLNNAVGRYQKFRYLVEDVDGYLQFDNERVTVHYLTGRGSGDSQVHLSGVITPPDNDASVSLQLRGTNVPVDARLREALEENELAAFDMMFNEPANDAMAAAGLLPDEDSLQRASILLQEIEEQIARASEAESVPTREQEQEIAELHESAACLRRHIEAGPFHLGGTVDLDLRINRNAGPNQRTATTGRIEIQSVGLMYDRFPYPLRIMGGVLDWQQDRIVITDNETISGLTVITPGGGHGKVTGELLVGAGRGLKQVKPDITISIDDDEFNDAVYAAIPMTKSERASLPGDARWPGSVLSRAAALVRGVGLAGPANYRGHIGTDADGGITYDFSLHLDSCRATPTLELAQSLGTTRRLWPDNFELQNVTGTVRVTQDQINVSRIGGRAGNCELLVNGSVDLTGEQMQTQFAIDFANLPVGDYILNIAPEGQDAAARQWWDRLSPSGVLDARLKYESKSDAEHLTSLEVYPRHVTLKMDDHPVTLTHTMGSLHVEGGFLTATDLAVDVVTDDRVSDGSVEFNGTANLHAGSEAIGVQGRWDNARPQSPAIAYLIQHFGSAAVSDGYALHEPAGLLDADFSISRVAGGTAEWWFEFQPYEFSATLNGHRLEAAFDEGTITLAPDYIRLDGMNGKHDQGTFAVAGACSLQPTLAADFLFDYAGNLRSDFVAALLPPTALRTLDGIEFFDRGATSIDNATLKIQQNGEDRNDLAFTFNGPVQTTAAKFDAGVSFTDVAGVFHFNIAHQPGAIPVVAIGADVIRAHAMGQHLENVEAVIALSDDGEDVVLRNFRATAGKGVISAQASAGLGVNGEYSAAIDMIDVPLNRFSTMEASESSQQVASAAANDASGGEVFAHLSLSGKVGQPHTRRGRGAVRIVDGTQLSVPLFMQLIQVAQLTMPFSGNLDFADAQMFVDGDRIVFDRIVFESNMGANTMFQLAGTGEMNFDTLELNTRFNSRGSVPVVRDIIGEIGDALYTIEVTGPLNNPRARIVPLPANN